MRVLPRLSVPELTAAHLREGLSTGRWSGTLPGVARLAAELDVAPATLRAALRLLEAEGLLGGRGLGRSRMITPHGQARHPLRVGFLHYDAPDDREPATTQICDEIRLALERAGHDVFFSHKSQAEFHHQMPRIARHLQQTPPDAWVVVAGSRELLEWCAAQPLPTMALYGRTDGLQIARTGPDKMAASLAVTRRLLELGHRRIVLISSGSRRKPVPGNIEQAFLEELAAHGITTGTYNLPHWEETPDGFFALLKSMFRHAPPTAMIIEQTPRMIATVQFLGQHGIQVPGHVSLVCTDYDRSLSWCQPGIAHIRWHNDPIIRRIVRWVDAVRKGRADCKTINFPAAFIPAGSIGPVRTG